MNHIETMSKLTDPSPTPRLNDLESKTRRRNIIENCKVKISNKMCDFISRPYGIRIHHFEVDMMVRSYIKRKKLLQKAIVTPDEHLKNLLGMHKEFPLFFLSQLIKQHYIL
tara:strand:- start:5794 stop:6126 length:333 start_codon:yes stop_codon:yes gene_type:complete